MSRGRSDSGSDGDFGPNGDYDESPKAIVKSSTVTSSRSLSNFLECFYCQEGFEPEGLKVPRILSCGHSMCQQCCHKLQKSTPTRSVIPCPLECGRTQLGDVGVECLDVNNGLLQQLSVLTKEVEPDAMPLCGECEENDASLHCSLCREDFCQKCSDVVHQSSKTLRKHLAKKCVVPIHRKPEEQPMCHHHIHQKIQLWCDTCQDLICVECQDPNFDGTHCGDAHVVKRIDHAGAEEKAKLSAVLEKNIKPRIHELTDALHLSHDAVVTGVKSSANMARSNVQTHFADLLDTLKQSLEARETELLAKVDYFEALKLQTLHAQRAILAVALSEAFDASQDCEKALQIDDIACMDVKAPRDSRMELVAAQRIRTEMVVGTNIGTALDETLLAQLVRSVKRHGSVAGPAPPRILDGSSGYDAVKLTWTCKADMGETIKEYAVEVARPQTRFEDQASQGAFIEEIKETDDAPGMPVTDFDQVYRGPDRHFTAGGLQSNQSYSFRVRARNEIGWGNYSAIRKFTTDDAPMGRQFHYSSPFDTNGILYHIGTRGGEQEYVNPGEKGWIGVSRSSSEAGKAWDAAGRQSVPETYTRREPGAWYVFDLKPTRRVVPTHYSIMHDQEKGYCLRSWNFEGSVDGKTWVRLREHVNDTTLNAPKATGTWQIQPSATAESGEPVGYRFFRLLSCDKNSSGDHYMVVSGFEVYGTLLKVVGGRVVNLRSV